LLSLSLKKEDDKRLEKNNTGRDETYVKHIRIDLDNNSCNNDVLANWQMNNGVNKTNRLITTACHNLGVILQDKRFICMLRVAASVAIKHR
jgi:hypothetical protein